ncbi:hypothetical protein ACFODZ_08220 [Marinicella sediminis]|uniref:IPTL-CTERM sorting domain-containing protein n=1 Tax=Marinicella sediminis TaxID=1792834 RepID=A0ABV7J7X1_9GAMM|nr:hypothetical protein [Marinicella sediminis]
MRSLKLSFTIVLISLSGMSMAVDETTDFQSDISQIPFNATDYVMGAGHNVIFDNGPIINSSGSGVGGADESILQDISLGMSTLGIGHFPGLNLRVSDEFIISENNTTISTIQFFAYQTNETASTITAINVRIWDGPPGQTGSQVVFGDTSTNRIISTQYSNINRLVELDSGLSNDRQIAVSEVLIDQEFNIGTYWLDWQSSGSGTSGPWVPPVSIVGVTSTGNALQSADDGMTFQPVLDSGTNTPLGLPFVITGTLPPPIVVPTLGVNGWLLLSLIILLATRAFRRNCHSQ